MLLPWLYVVFVVVVVDAVAMAATVDAAGVFAIAITSPGIHAVANTHEQN